LVERDQAGRHFRAMTEPAGRDSPTEETAWAH
jgi:hypothetical protein